MLKIFKWNAVTFRDSTLSKTLLIMKLSTILLLVTFFTSKADVFSQEKEISINLGKVPIHEVFNEIEKRSPYRLVYSSTIFPSSKIVEGNFTQVEVSAILDKILKNTGFQHRMIDENLIVISRLSKTDSLVTIRGTLTDNNGNRMPGVTVLVKGTKQATVTSSDGEYEITLQRDRILSFYFVGFKRKEAKVNRSSRIDIQLEEDINNLDETVVVGYGTTTKRFNTGSVASVTAADIAKQPIANVLQGLQGLIPGMSVVQSTGYNTGQFNIAIRGRKDIYNGVSNPLIILNGIPLPTSTGDLTNSGLNQNALPGNNLGQNAFYGINPADIESMEILKDADATAIYGSRGANGVILITTKKGKPGRAKFDVNYYAGLTTPPKKIELLNTAQYLEMRREAFANDQIIPDESNAPDLTRYSQTRYTDWQKKLASPSMTSDAQIAYSGGSEKTTFRISGGYHQDKTPVPSDFKYVNFNDRRLSSELNLSHRSEDNRFSVSMTMSFSNSLTNNPAIDYYDYKLAPNAPGILDGNGNLNYTEYGNFGMPLAFQSFFQKYKTNTDNLIGSANLEYHLIKGLDISTSLGYTNTKMDQLATYPKTIYAQPEANVSQAQYGTNSIKSWIVEPKAQYTAAIGDGQFQATMGGTLTQSITEGDNVAGTGYANDNLIEDQASAQNISTMTNYAKYKFQGYFARLNYNYRSKLILNLTGRRDGSSRFKSGSQMGNFGSVGGAWIFTEEKFIKEKLPILSFGKIRASYGTTGSASAGDYKYLELWRAQSSSTVGYDGSGILNLIQPFNSGFSWQVNKKFEAGIELGFLKDRISLTGVVYRERAGNQLVNYIYPTYLGLNPIVTNIPALVQNQGLEVTVNTVNIKSNNFNWTTAFNISFNRNKLVAYPGIELSSYANSYSIGQSLSIQKLYHYTGIDPQNGTYTFLDRNNDGSFDEKDRFDVNLDPKFNGGIINNFQYKNWELSFIVDFKKQKGPYSISDGVPGTPINQPIQVMDRWQKPGDIKEVHKYTTIRGGDLANYSLSDATIHDASYMRLQNLAVSYNFTGELIKKLQLSKLRLVLQGQNLFILSPYKGLNPINPKLTSFGFPPQRILTGGLQASL